MSNYEDFYGFSQIKNMSNHEDFVIEKKEEKIMEPLGFQIHIKNVTCKTCDKLIFENDEDIYRKKCGHAFHITCVSNEMLKEKYCLICVENNQKPKKTKKILDFNNLTIKDQMENEKEIQNHFDNLKKIEINSKLSESDKKKIYCLKADTIDKFFTPKKKINRTEINFDFLKFQNITINELLDIDINIDKIYFGIGLKEWQNLLDLGLNKIDLKIFQQNNSFDIPMIPLTKLQQYYGVDLMTLNRDLRINKDDLIEMKVSPLSMYSLGMNVETLRFYFDWNSTSFWKMYELNRTKMEEWVHLGLTKKSCQYLFGIDKNNCEILDWDYDLLDDE